MYLKTLIDELDLIIKTIIIDWNVWKKKDLLLLATKLIKNTMLIVLKILSIYLEKQKRKIGETIKNINWTTKNYRKPKDYWHKVTLQHSITSHKLS